MIVWISTGNSDDKLSQMLWSSLITHVDDILAMEQPELKFHARKVHSMPDVPYQNCHWCIEIPPYLAEKLKKELIKPAKAYMQDSIAWNEVVATEHIKREPNEAQRIPT